MVIILWIYDFTADNHATQFLRFHYVFGWFARPLHVSEPGRVHSASSTPIQFNLGARERKKFAPSRAEMNWRRVSTFLPLRFVEKFAVERAVGNGFSLFFSSATTFFCSATTWSHSAGKGGEPEKSPGFASDVIRRSLKFTVEKIWRFSGKNYRREALRALLFHHPNLVSQIASDADTKTGKIDFYLWNIIQFPFLINIMSFYSDDFVCPGLASTLTFRVRFQLCTRAQRKVARGKQLETLSTLHSWKLHLFNIQMTSI